MQYHHTQKALLYGILILVGIAMFVGASLVPEKAVQVTLLVSGGLMFLLAFCFRQLTVCDEGDRLLIAFGPLPLFRRRIRFADMEIAEKGRTTFLDGWGIHLSLSGGWVWNLWGFDCVDVWYKNGRKVRIGTDDPIGLEAYLRDRMKKQGKALK